jgi:predicted phosphodiesterase
LKYGQPDAKTIAELTALNFSPGDIAHRLGCKVKDLKTLRYNPPGEFDPTPMGEPLHLDGDFIVVGDPHVPYTDYAFSSNIGRVAEKTGIRRLIVDGDFFTMDNWSKYASSIPPATWHQERNAAKILIGDWLEVFTEIYIIQGNHDRRLTNWSEAQLDESDVWGMINTSTKIKHTKFGYCTVNSAGIPWRVTHPVNYGRRSYPCCLTLQTNSSRISSAGTNTTPRRDGTFTSAGWWSMAVVSLTRASWRTLALTTAAPPAWLRALSCCGAEWQPCWANTRLPIGIGG